MVQFKNSPLTEEFWEIHSGLQEEKTFVTCGHVDNYYVTKSGEFVLIVQILDGLYVEGRYSIKEHMNHELWELLKDFNCLRCGETATLFCIMDYMAVDVEFSYSDVCKTHFPTSICCNDRLHCKFSDSYSSKDIQKVMENCYHEQEKAKRMWREQNEITI